AAGLSRRRELAGPHSGARACPCTPVVDPDTAGRGLAWMEEPEADRRCPLERKRRRARGPQIRAPQDTGRASGQEPGGLHAWHPSHLAAARYGPRQREELNTLLQVDHDLVAPDLQVLPCGVLERTEVLLSGWNPPQISDDILNRMPNLHLVAHAGGGMPGRELLERRGIAVVGQTSANAIPTAEFSVAMILLANTQAFRAQRLYQARRTFLDREEHF